MTGAQAQPCTNWLPLEFTILPQKLAQSSPAPYTSHVVGKGHWGYQTTDHLPIRRGFASHVGYLAGAEDYVHGDNYGPTHDCSSAAPHEWCFQDMWHDNHTGADVIDQIEYSTNYYAARTVALIEAAPAGAPLALFLLYQGVHVPYGAIPAWEQKPVPGFWDQTYGNMLRLVDDGVANVTAALRAAGRWDDTLLLVTSDNGGIQRGNNYPLRGLKATVWEGGTRVMAFVAGGYLEAEPGFDAHLRNTTSERFVHISDWYATFSALAGVDPADNATYDGVVRPIDGIDVWPLLTAPARAAAAREAGASAAAVAALAAPPGHGGEGGFLPITEQTIIWNERYKLVTGAQATHWYGKNQTTFPDNRTAWPCRNHKPPSPSPSPPSPSPPSPPAANCTPVVGFACETAHYCGPSHTFFWEGSATLADCAAACAQQMHGSCKCFDWREAKAPGDAAQCRHHPSGDALQPSGQRYSAYASVSAEAREWLARVATAQVYTGGGNAASSRAAAVAGAGAMAAHTRRPELQPPPGVAEGTAASCSVCTAAEPCLFDLLADPQEREDIALSNPDVVATMQAALARALSWRINGTMNADVLANGYDCVTNTVPWWGNYSGPCCKPKKA